MKTYLFWLLNCVTFTWAWYPCSLNTPSQGILPGNITVQAECMFLPSPLEWKGFNPNTFDGAYYNRTRQIPLMNIHLKRLFLTSLQNHNHSKSKPKHIINYWLVNGGGGSQAGMESFGLSTLKQIVINNYHTRFPDTFPVMYLFQYRGAGMSEPSIHCPTAKTWIDCAKELINTTHPVREESLRIIHAVSNQHIAQDLQYQIQYAINQSEPLAKTSTYIYGLSQGTGILQYYLTIQSIDQQVQHIDGVILDAVMGVEQSDVFRNQIKSINDRFYLYLSKCQADRLCAKAFARVVGSEQDILSITLKLQMLFSTNQTAAACTTNLGLTSWDMFTLIANQIIEKMIVRPMAAILIARISRCSAEDQRVLAHVLPKLIAIALQATDESLIDPPDAFPYDGDVLSITTIWSDFVGFDLDQNFKTNIDYFNTFCFKSDVVNEYYLSSTGTFPICRATRSTGHNYSLSQEFRDILYEKNPRYWGKLQVDRNIFRSIGGGVLLFNGDLDFNSPLYSAQQVEMYLHMRGIAARLVQMKGLAHVTSTQSHMKEGGFQSTTCTDQIIVQFLYHDELNLNLSTIDEGCNSPEHLIGIDWFASDSTINHTFYDLFGSSTVDYWGINMTRAELETLLNAKPNQSSRTYFSNIFLLFSIAFYESFH